MTDGTIAGSTTHLMKGVQKAISFGIPVADAIKMATITPARAVGIDSDRGSVSVGNRADFVLWNKDYSINTVFYRGKI